MVEMPGVGATHCPACRGAFIPTFAPWLVRCEQCGLWAWHCPGDGSYDPAAGPRIDEARRARGLAASRQVSHRKVLTALERHRHGRPLRLLDVGAAHGWFLREARARGHEALGVEPDPQTASLARQEGLEIIAGFFPQDVPPGLTFDGIVFNDVIEHLPDPCRALEACRARIAAGGLLAVCVPVSDGALFGLAIALHHLGVRSPWERLWQKGLASPHRFYFSHNNLVRLMGRHGFRLAHREPLRAFERRGLWARVHFDRRPTLLSASLFLALWIAAPVFRWLPSDHLLFVFERDA